MEGEVWRHECERDRRGEAPADENARLKKLVVDLNLNKDMLQSVIRKNSLGSHPTVEDLSAATPVCELIGVPRSSGRYQSRKDDSRIAERLRELAREHPRFGYRRLYLYLREEMKVNHKKVQRVYRELGLKRETHAAQASAAHTRAAAHVDSAQQGMGPSEAWRASTESCATSA